MSESFQHYFLENRLLVTVGDITEQKVETIVNAANSTLLGGGGVDGAIHSKGGQIIYEECKKIRQTQYPQGLPTGEAVITSGGNLFAKFVIHTVGPIYGKNNGEDAQFLAKSYRNCLELAVKNNISRIAFPSISTGAFSYPKPEAAKVSAQTIKEFLSNDNNIEEVRLVFYLKSDAQIFIGHSFL